MNGRMLLVIVAATALLGTTVWALQREPQPGSARWPTPEDVDSLSRYLTASEPAPRLDDYAVFLPAEGAPEIWIPPAEVEALSPLSVSAILITGERRMAIINDRPVRAGQALAGGAVVVSIARDHVVVRERSGMLRTIRLATGND